jgi:hypothetical protein
MPGRRPRRLGAGQVLELLEGFSIQQSDARPHADAASLLADGAVSMVFGMPGALLSAAFACANASLQQAVDHDLIPVSQPGQNSRGELANIRAIQAERDARAHFSHVVLGEIRVRARRAGLDAAQAGVDRSRDFRNAGRHIAWKGTQDLAGVRHRLNSSIRRIAVAAS